MGWGQYSKLESVVVIQSPRNKSLMGKAAGAYHIEDYDSTNFTRRNKSKWSTVGGALDGGSVGAAARPFRNMYRGLGYFRTFQPNTFDNRCAAPSRPVDLRAGFRVESRFASNAATGLVGASMLIARVSNFGGSQMQLGLRDSSMQVQLNGVSLTIPVSDTSTDFIWRAWEVLPFESESGDLTANFFASDDGETWTLLGSDTKSAPIYAAANHPFGWGNNSTGLVGAGARINEVRYFEGGALVHLWRAEDCGQGGYTEPTTGTAWTIFRASSGPKSVLVNRNAGSHALYGTDKFAEVADNSALNFGAGEEFSFVSVSRAFGNASGNEVIVSKKAGTGTAETGYAVFNTTATPHATTALSDGTVQVFTSGLGFRDGMRNILSSHRNALGNSFMGVNGIFGTVNTTAGALDYTTTLPLRMGRHAVASSFGAYEETFTAIFRRALTVGQLARLKWEAETFARKF
jgi:hypothetical protein